MEVKILSCNLYSDPRVGLDLLPQLLGPIKPDILCLQQAVNPTDVPSYYPKLKEYGGFTTAIVNARRFLQPVATLSVAQPTYRRLHFHGWKIGAVETAFRFGSQSVTIVNLELDPNNLANRLSELTQLLRHVNLNQPVILIGSFYALTATDIIRPVAERLIANDYPDFHSAGPRLFEAMDYLRKTGFTDYGSAPWRDIRHTSSFQDIPLRLDYALGNPLAKQLKPKLAVIAKLPPESQLVHCPLLLTLTV